MTEKIVEGAKQISVKVAEAACAASHSLGLSDGLMLLGVVCIGASMWLTSQRKFPREWVKHVQSLGSEE